MGGYQQYQYEMFDLDPQHPLKVISQPLFDHAAEHGFPPDFFTGSYFDRVTFGPIPEGTDCSFSAFRNCTFDGCKINKCVFDSATIYDTVFRHTELCMVNFTGASIAHTQFQDCRFAFVSFLDARLKSGLMRDCSLDIVDFKGAELDGTWFGGVKARYVLNLHHATITQGGAAQEEVDRLRTSTFQALGVTPFFIRQRPPAPRRRKPRIPER